jgi:serine/threonine protein phosphatase PrpC
VNVRLRWGSATHEGQLRVQNEDHAHAGDGLFVVADGMGGHLAGEVASEMAVKRLETRLPFGVDNTLEDLVSAIHEANVEIYNGSISNPAQAGMGTTVTAIGVVTDPLDGHVLGIANVGDSRSYVLRHGRLRQVTVDHSFVQELVAEGAITRAEARLHPRRNIVTRALGIESGVRVDSWTMPIIRSDRFVLCSDGLVDEIDDDQITEVLKAHPDDPGAAAQALVDAANAAGGRDNITVVVFDVLEGDDPPNPTEEFDVIPVWSDDNVDNTGEQRIVTDPLPEHHDPTAADTTTDSGTAEIPALYDGGGDITPVEGAITPNVTPEAAPTKRGGRFARFVLGLGVAAVLVLAFAILAAWARSGYFVAFDDDGEVVIYQGKQDGVLWFEPTREATGQYDRDELDAESIELVERRQEFESQSSAAQFVAERLTPTTTTSTTTTTTTTTTVVTTTTVAETTEESTPETSTGT